MTHIQSAKNANTKSVNIFNLCGAKPNVLFDCTTTAIYLPLILLLRSLLEHHSQMPQN